MIPTERALADMADVECEQDGGDPFGWWDGSTLTPEGAGRGLAGARSAEQASGGEPEPDAEKAQRGAHGRGTGNGGAK